MADSLTGSFRVRAIRPAFADVHRLFNRTRDKVEVRRHALKLRYWPDSLTTFHSAYSGEARDMATTTRSRSVDPEMMTSKMFAQVFQAFMECTDEIQGLIREMVAIVNDPAATDDEQFMACST